MNLKDKRVFVSGGNGVIGNELVIKLQKSGAKILVGDLKPRPIHWPAEIIYRQGDLNYITKDELFEFNPQIFIHLAATFERSVETYDFWYENFHHNILLSNHLMSLLKDSHDLKKVIFASSYLIFDQSQYNFKQPQQHPVTLPETSNICPRNLTGMAKLAHETELNFLLNFKKSSYSACNARIFRGYGKNSRDVISRWVRSLINNEPIYLYNKEGLFDYIFAEDTAEGLIKLAETDYSGTINLGTGNSRPVSVIISILKNYFPDMNVIEKQEDILYEASQADITLLKNITGWSPEISLEEGINKIIDFEKKRDGIYSDNQDFFGNILITSISKKVPLIQSVKLAAKKCSNSIKVFGGDIDENCIGRHFVDEFWLMPHSSLLSVKNIIDFCHNNNINTIIPTRDGELLFWATSKRTLEENKISVMISPDETVNKCLDKLSFYNWGMKFSVPIIETSLNIEDIHSDIFVVKEQFGAGSVSLGLKLNKNSATQHAEKLSKPVFQPFIEGYEISIDVYSAKTGKCKGVVLRKRNFVVNGESQITTTFLNDELYAFFKKLADDLEISGHAVFQAIIDKDNKLHLIECNCRFGGASTLSLQSGLDSFYWFILESNNVNIEQYEFIQSSSEKKLIRHPVDFII